MKNRKLLLGNEAIALGAIRAGVRVVAGYPGTPSSEILETVAKNNNGSIYVEWSVNEKAALEVAAGAAFAGARSMVTMKQVGLNVASDPLMSLNYLGVLGGMVVVVADDPGPISSQTEQDTRHFSRYAKLALFDPSTPEEAYLMIADAFELSEKYGEPVLLRPTTRVCHSCASVDLLGDLQMAEPAGFTKSSRWVIFPRLSYANKIKIEEKLVAMSAEFSGYDKNLLICGRACATGETGIVTKKGIATGGVSYTFVREALDEGAHGGAAYKLLKVSAYPFPDDMALRFLEGLDEVLAVEELDPVIEDELVRLCGLHHLKVKVKGKRTGHIQNAGENSPQSVTNAIKSFMTSLHEDEPCTADGKDAVPVEKSDWASGNSEAMTEKSVLAGGKDKAPADLANDKNEAPAECPPLPVRPPVLCAGCPHRASFFAVKEAVGKAKAVYTGDIGCYTLGNAPPLDMVDTCICMGGGITVAQGLHRIEPDTAHFAFIGDSTFFHAGITGVINAVYNQTDIIVVILDNATTAMTGNQPHPGMGVTMMGGRPEKISIEKIVKAIGVTAFYRINPFDQQAAKDAVKSALTQDGVRVILFDAPCIVIGRPGGAAVVDRSRCTGCKLCMSKLGCPAISLMPDDKPGDDIPGRAKSIIDPSLCTGCGVCAGICPIKAIHVEKGDAV